MSDYTPGPWTFGGPVDRDKIVRRWLSPDYVGADINTLPPTYYEIGVEGQTSPPAIAAAGSEANARLIAAAPELLAALVAAVGDFGSPCPHCQGKGKIPGSRNWVAQGYVEADCWHCHTTGKAVELPWYRDAEAAIAKALGLEVPS